MRLDGGVASGTGEMTREARSSFGAADGMTRGARDGSGLGTGTGGLSCSRRFGGGEFGGLGTRRVGGDCCVSGSVGLGDAGWSVSWLTLSVCVREVSSSPL